jgi:hypothetical protein
MKKLVLLTAALMFSLSAVFAQQTAKLDKTEIKGNKEEMKTERKALRKLEGTEVSYMAKNEFTGDFPSAKDVSWERVDTYDVVAFTNNGKKMKGYYDYDGKLVGTTMNKTFSDIPSAAQKEIKRKYNGYTIGPVIFYDDNEANDTDMILWATQFASADNYFVELDKGKEQIILKVDPYGLVSFFKELS